ncbi:hypothetical protein YH63_011550 [Afipia massiliensis]|uniref:Uncharacterized protein n=1 Tax=Afipia massiliensis TaxID=211460 RepID=A0A4U6BT83_9BRAD|nr:hypothetical protein [Afipia massiliensis]TKT72004.1 hypothetical protein YH63_011550 [Afipia massiliensis]
MADYYPLIARAIAGLDPSAPGEQRRALYERARTALISQLRGVQPALSEAEITRERLALEDAVRRVEADAARRAAALQGNEPPRERPAAPPPPGPSAPPPSAQPRAPLPGRREGPRPGDALRESARSARGGTAPPPPGRPAPRPDANGAPEQRPPRNLRGDQPPPTRAQPPGPQQGLPTSMRDVRARDQRSDDTRMLDEFTEGARMPRRAPQGSGMRDVVADANDLGSATRSARRSQAQDFPDQRGGPAPYSYDESAEEAGRYQPNDRPRARIQSRDEPETAKRGFPVKTAIAVCVAIIAIGGAVWGGPKVYSLVKSLTTKPAQQQADTAQKDASGTRPKITDRVGQPGSAQIAPVAQRVVLYDEDPSAPQGKQYVGSVIWRTEAVKVPAGQPPDIGVRADIDIPERKIKMSLSIRRNTDASLPASHTAELTFVLPPDFGTTIANVPGVLMKSNEQARGTPLAGLAVKVTDGFFLVGLSNVEADKSRNLQLLKERSWFDIPLVYANQRRSIIAIEKGAPGERAFNEAFTAWGQ